MRTYAETAKNAGKQWMTIKWPGVPSRLEKTAKILQVLYHRLMAKKYRDSLTPARKTALQEKLQASEMFKNKKKIYPQS